MADAEAQPLTDGEALYRQAGQTARTWSARWSALMQRLRRESAGKRAERLLLEHLTPAQRRQYKAEGCITVPGRLYPYYRINKGRVGNVEVLDERGNVTHRLCAHPTGNVPDPDVMLAQVLMLHHHEREFVNVANRLPR